MRYDALDGVRDAGQAVEAYLGATIRRHHRIDVTSWRIASQFNLLEMTSPEVTPDNGVTRYDSDPTQGPACAIAAGAATSFRNYFADVGGRVGQTAHCQLDGLGDLGHSLTSRLGRPVSSLWEMQSGYAQCTRTELRSIAEHLESLNAEQRGELIGNLGSACIAMCKLATG